MHISAYLRAMTLDQWLSSRPRGALKQLEFAASVGNVTLHKARRGVPLSRYAVAKRISEATGGAVSIAELCEPDSFKPKRRKAKRRRRS